MFRRIEDITLYEFYLDSRRSSKQSNAMKRKEASSTSLGQITNQIGKIEKTANQIWSCKRTHNEDLPSVWTCLKWLFQILCNLQSLHHICFLQKLIGPRFFIWTKAGGRAVDLGGPNVYQGGPRFEIKHKSRCLQKSKLVDWGAKHVEWRRPWSEGLWLLEVNYSDWLWLAVWSNDESRNGAWGH